MTIIPSTIYETLLRTFHHQHWWPVDTKYHNKNKTDPRFEIILGAILTQNTQWNNVKQALQNLKADHIFSLKRLKNTPTNKLKELIKPSGFFNQKAQRLQTITTYFLETYEGDLTQFFNQKTANIRTELLTLNGIGPETADSILLYAGNHPVFVIDAYTRRISTRLHLPTNSDSYKDLQRYFQEDLQHRYPAHDLSAIYKETHALLVELAKRHCTKTKPACTTCPLHQTCPSAQLPQ